ncbi:MAG TPA: DUF1552 domain-containing protein [Polyangia bacterium]|nr:DUF1552 domain-containing protein [Polyangia bacterium]
MISIVTRVTRARLSRRAFLRRVGASAALLPLLHTERARAATPSGFPKRLVTIAWSNGVAGPLFFPPGDDPTASQVLAPLAPLKAKVTLVAGIDHQAMLDDNRPFDGHFGFPTLFTGTYKNVGGQSSTATGPSIDQVVSDAVAKQVNLPVPLLNITAQGLSTSFRADGTRNTGETSPARLFKTVFASPTLSPAALAALNARRKSVLDYLGGELSTFGARLGADDQAKIGAHLQSIRQLETALASQATAPTAACAAVDPGAPTDYRGTMKAFSDLVAMALRCDVTRAVSLVWADDNGSGPYTLPFLDLGGSDMDIGEVHAIAHGAGSIGTGWTLKARVDTWYMTQLAYLAQALDASAEGSGTTLDNSLLVMGNDMSNGSTHSVSGVPFVLVGRAGGALRAGRVVRAGPFAGSAGAPPTLGTSVGPTDLTGLVGNLPAAPAGTDRGATSNNHLLASVSNLMDVPCTGFGKGYSGTLAGL